MERVLSEDWLYVQLREPTYILNMDVVDLCTMWQTQVEEKKTVDDVPIVRVYPNIFLEELLGVPPKRKIEFRIDLILSEPMISKAPYRLAPLEMHELSTEV